MNEVERGNFLCVVTGVMATWWGRPQSGPPAWMAFMSAFNHDQEIYNEALQVVHRMNYDRIQASADFYRYGSVLN